MSDVPRWSLSGELRPVAMSAGRLSLAARVDAARCALEFVEDGLANGLPVPGTRRKLSMRLRDELLLTAVRNALGLIDER